MSKNPRLSPELQQTLEGLQQDYTPETAAEQFNISVKEVLDRRRRLREAMGCDTDAGVVAQAHSRGMVSRYQSSRRAPR